MPSTQKKKFKMKEMSYKVDFRKFKNSINFKSKVLLVRGKKLRELLTIRKTTRRIEIGARILSKRERKD